MAASELSTLCRPGRFNVTASAPAPARSTEKWVRIPSPWMLVGAHIGARGQPVGKRRARDLLHDAAHVLIVATQHRESVERQVVQKIEEALLEQTRSRRRAR